MVPNKQSHKHNKHVQSSLISEVKTTIRWLIHYYDKTFSNIVAIGTLNIKALKHESGEYFQLYQLYNIYIVNTSVRRGSERDPRM